jgi:type IV pilus assembly protein PilY1
MKGASAAKRGWYHDLTGTVTGAKKNYEEGYALRGDLYMPVYDPKVDLNNASDCSAKVVGATDLYRFCLPYGVCPDIAGANPFGIFRLGAGIQGITIAPTGTDGRTTAIGFNQPNVTNSISTNNQNTYNYTSTPTVIPTAWFEKRPDPSKFK